MMSWIISHLLFIPDMVQLTYIFKEFTHKENR